MPLTGLRVSVNGAYTHARLTRNLPPPTFGGSGEPLAYIPNWTADANLDYEHTLMSRWSGFAGIGYHYSDNRRGDFPVIAPPRNLLPSYALVDLKAGLKSGPWTFTAYVKNLTNQEVVTGLYDNTFSGGAGEEVGVTLPPRTMGVEIETRLWNLGNSRGPSCALVSGKPEAFFSRGDSRGKLRSRFNALERTMRKIKRRSEQAWRELVAGQAQSGLSVADFCRREGISAWSLYGWRKRLRSGDSGRVPVGMERNASEPAPGFIDLGAVASGWPRCEIRLELGGGVVLHLVRG